MIRLRIRRMLLIDPIKPFRHAGAEPGGLHAMWPEPALAGVSMLCVE
jgi:hypothetical protein